MSFTNEKREELRRLRVAIRDDVADEWKPALDRYDITAVMIDLAGASGAIETYKQLTQSPNWIPFYDDGRVVIFGRADAREPDLATFKNQPARAGIESLPRCAVRSLGRSSADANLMDRRFLQEPSGRPAADAYQCGGALASRRDAGRRSAHATRPSAGVCWRSAKREPPWQRIPTTGSPTVCSTPPTASLRKRKPHSSPASRSTARTRRRVSALVPNIDVLTMRFKQRVTALNYAILTTPPPKTPDARRELQALNMELFQLFLQAGYIDLARDRLQIVLDQVQPGDFPSPEAESQYRQQLEQLNQRFKQVEDNLMDLQVERQAGPVEKAMPLAIRGHPGWPSASSRKPIAAI